MKKLTCLATTAASLAILAAASLTPAQASSHREAPMIAGLPTVNSTDVYFFRSYEDGREDFVTFIMNYFPFQPVYGGPNFFPLDPNAIYYANFDNNGDGNPDFQFRFLAKRTNRALTVPVGSKNQQIALINHNPISDDQGSVTSANQNLTTTYTIDLLRPGKSAAAVTNADTNATDKRNFAMPLDNIGNYTIGGKRFNDPNPGADASLYHTYVGNFIYDIKIPGCAVNGRVFVGQRKEAFNINLSELFDTFNVNIEGPPDAFTSDLEDDNVTSFALEIPTTCLVNAKSNDPVVGAWTTANIRKNINPRGGLGPTINNTGDSVQVSRLGNPLVNEVITPLGQKDRYSNSSVKDDASFTLNNVRFPSISQLIHEQFTDLAVPPPPREDLVAILLTGLPAAVNVGVVTRPSNPKAIPADEMRLATDSDIVACGAQNADGIVGGDPSGYPNGRRPGDDVVDISLQVVMGKVAALTNPAFVKTPAVDTLTDGTAISCAEFQTAFPYLNDPVTGSPRPAAP